MKSQRAKIPPTLKLRRASKSQKLNMVLEEIVANKKMDLARQKKEISLKKLKDFAANLDIKQGVFKKQFLDQDKLTIIAEIKLASPADSSFKPDVHIMDRANEYERSGADAISYITERYYFKGDVLKIIEIGAKVKLPILQKDFVIDEYQIYEAKIVGSSALLLIARLIDKKKLVSFIDLCLNLGIDPVVEINSNDDLQKVLGTNASIIAINARDLSTFELDLDKAYQLMTRIPTNYIKLGFSGINSVEDVKKYKTAGAKGVLVGTALMKTKNIKEMIASFKI